MNEKEGGHKRMRTLNKEWSVFPSAAHVLKLEQHRD